MAAEAWGGSEELWSRTAVHLHELGESVCVSVPSWPERPVPIRSMLRMGIPVHFRQDHPTLWRRATRSLLCGQRDPWLPLPGDRRWLDRQHPRLVVVSQGGPWDGLPWMLACRSEGIRYHTIVQANSEAWWPEDFWLDLARQAYAAAERVYFVSHANRELLEHQCGMTLPQAEIVHNPWNDCDTGRAPWPSVRHGHRLACVGRLDPRAKGQDLAIRMLAVEPWKSRPLHLTLHGGGPCGHSLRLMADRLAMKNLSFAGHISNPTRIWEKHHALLLPSRHEGLPLVIVEAMRHARTVITTAVADNSRLLTDGVNGFVSPAAAPQPLAETLQRAWDSRHRWREMGLLARETVLDLLPQDPVADFSHRLLA